MHPSPAKTAAVALALCGLAAPAVADDSFMRAMQEKIAAQVRGMRTGAPSYTPIATIPADYPWYNVTIVAITTSVDPDGLQWGDTQVQPGQPVSLEHLNWKNTTTEVQNYSSTMTDTYVDTFEWSTTQALTVGASVTVSAGLPVGVNVGATLSTEVSLSSTKTTTSTHDRSWSRTASVAVAPNSQTYASLVLTPAQATATWSVPVVVDGAVALGGLLYGGVDWAPPMKALREYLPESDRTFVVTGSFEAQVGTDVQVCTEEYPLDGTRSVCP